MESKGGALVSESELNKSVKSLRATKGREHTDSFEYDTQIAEKLGTHTCEAVQYLLAC